MKSRFKIAIQMDPWSAINVNTDSTYLIALEAQRRGYELFSYQPSNLSLDQGVIKATGNFVSLSIKLIKLREVTKCYPV